MAPCWGRLFQRLRNIKGTPLTNDGTCFRLGEDPAVALLATFMGVRIRARIGFSLVAPGWRREPGYLTRKLSVGRGPYGGSLRVRAELP
ncbi:hypothetical protein MYMAC_006161 [Corallococcus macrosporus DSM 14697]|uniref:Uncharacterized protein n=1 Tax=Corallococcus macrosporus DSM 14697 TaxID=1189310 RepID=A0A250K365_9BACT|nr:hypothetical protein MYMAC_006161 [Corallococcus macrosporus DSM 14697]